MCGMQKYLHKSISILISMYIIVPTTDKEQNIIRQVWDGTFKTNKGLIQEWNLTVKKFRNIPIGGSKGYRDPRALLVNFFNYHAFFSKILLNNRLAPMPLELAPRLANVQQRFNNVSRIWSSSSYGSFIDG